MPDDSAATDAKHSRPNLIPYHWKKGFKVPGSGRPKGLLSLKRRFRDAFGEVPSDGGESLANVVLAIARGDALTAEIKRAAIAGADDPDRVARMLGKLHRTSVAQLAAIRFCAEYGFGLPSKNLDDETVARQAEQRVLGMLIEAREAAARKRAEEEGTEGGGGAPIAIDVDIVPEELP